jgi:UDP-GlcNAc:undecaprenyl-phosphate GlcNAc-1-phosphate transferase
MWLTLFLSPFLTAFTLTAGLILVFLLVPLFRRKAWRFGERHRYGQALSRHGGIAMLIAFLITFFFDPHLVMTREFIGLFIGVVLISLFGLWDDVSELGWKIQVFFQVALAVVIFIFGMRIASITNPFGGVWMFPAEGFVIPGFLMLFLWLFLVMNAMNWLDGLDGLCGGVALITLLTVFFLSLKPEVNQPPIALLSIIGVGAVSGFLLFNIHPARILAGTVGSMFLGFLIAVLAIVAGTKIATALLVLALPIADALWVIGERLRAGASVFQPDQRHLHYKLRELGWSEGRIAWVFSLVTAVIAVIALNTQSLGKFVAILLVLAIIFSLLLFVEQKTKSKKRMHA